MEIRNDNGLLLDLMPGQAMTLEQSAGWVSDEDLPGAFSYPISFPLNENNERFLASAYRPGFVWSGSINNSGAAMRIAVTARLEGVLYRRCVLNYRVQDGRGDGYLAIDAGEAYQELKDKRLRDVVSEKVELLPPGGPAAGNRDLGKRMAEIARYTPGLFPVTYFPIKNDGFWETDIAQKVTEWAQVQEFHKYLNPYSVYNKTFVVDGFVGNGLSIARGRAHVPQPYLTYIVDRIFRSVGWQLVGDWKTDEEVARLTVLNLTAVPALSESSYQPLLLDTGLIVPDVTVADFLKTIRQRYGLVVTGNGNDRTVSIRSFKKAANSPATLDLTPYLVGKWGIEAPDAKGFSVVDFVDSADELMKDPKTNQTLVPKALKVGRGTTKIDLRAGTTLLQRHRYIEQDALSGFTVADFPWFVPAVKQPGNTVDPNYSRSDRYYDPTTAAEPPNKPGIRLLSYRGIVQAREGYEYPLASPDVRNAKQQVIGYQTTKLDGRYGLWRTTLEPYYQFRDQTRPVTAQFLMPVSVFTQLKLDEPVRLALDDEARFRLLPDKVQAQTPGTSGMVKVRMRALTLPNSISDGTYNDPPVVWVELIVTPGPERTYAYNDRAERTTFSVTETRASLRVRVWADENRTTPAQVLQPGGGPFAGLVIRVRKTLTPRPRNRNTNVVASDGIEEWLILSADVEFAGNELIAFYRWDISLSWPAEDYRIDYTLELGDAYNIL